MRRRVAAVHCRELAARKASYEVLADGQGNSLVLLMNGTASKRSYRFTLNGREESGNLDPQEIKALLLR